MKNLLLGSALAASVLLAGASFAETKVSGSIETTINTKTVGTAGLTDDTTPSTIGHESSIKISSSKELDNGFGMSAGFNLVDGAREDQFIKITTGGTTFAVGNDVSGVADNVSQEDFTPNVAQDFHSAGTGGTIGGVNTVHGNNGIYLKHAMDLVTVEGVYTPSTSAGKTTAASANGATPGSGYDLAIYGNLGLEGLKVGYGVSASTSDVSSDGDTDGKAMGIKYAMNGFTVGYGKTTNTTSADVATDNITYGISYQVNDQLSVALVAGEVQVDAVATDEDYQSIQVGYDFGGLGVTAGYYEVENISGTAGSDNEIFEIRSVTKF